MNVLDRDQVVSAFPEDDRAKLSMPALGHLSWDNLDYLSWLDRTGGNGFCVFETGGTLTGIVLERTFIRTTNARSFMCSLCRTTHDRLGIASFTYKCHCGTGYHTLTDMFCAKLECSHYVRGMLQPEGLQFYETISTERKIERLHEGIDRYLASLADFEHRHRPRPNLRLV